MAARTAHWSSRFVLVGAAVTGVAVAAVAIALGVVATTRPSDAEIRRAVAADLGVPEPLLDVPLVDRLVAHAGEQARASVAEELDSSLALGALAGVLSAVLGAVGVAWLARSTACSDTAAEPHESAPSEHPASTREAST